MHETSAHTHKGVTLTSNHSQISSSNTHTHIMHITLRYTHMYSHIYTASLA